MKTFSQWMLTMLFAPCLLISFGQTPTSTYTFSGTIGQSAIVMDFYIPANWYNYDSGEYYYAKIGKRIPFAGMDISEVDESERNQKLYEEVNGLKTGYFVFDSQEYFLLDVITRKTILTGTWHSMDQSTSYKVNLKFVKSDDGM